MRTPRFTLPITVLTSVTLAAALALPAAASAATRTSGSPVATGTVTDAAGRPVADAQVGLYAWPPGPVLKHLRIGQSVPTRLVGSASTTASGHYAITLTSSSAVTSSAAVDGIVNLQLDASSPNGFGSWSFSRRVVKTAHGVALDDATTDGPPHAVPAESADIHMATTHTRTRAVSRACGWGILKTYKPSWTIVAGTFSRTRNVRQSFNYEQGQSSNLGVGQSSSGKKGTFTEDGTANFSASTGEDYRPRNGHTSTRYETKFIHSEFGHSCGSGIDSYLTKPTDYAGGAKGVKTTAPRATHCVGQERGSTFRKHTTSAFTFGTGFEIPVINLTLSAQTGYDISAEVAYHFFRAGNMCGTNAYPGQIPKRLVAEHR